MKITRLIVRDLEDIFAKRWWYFRRCKWLIFSDTLTMLTFEHFFVWLWRCLLLNTFLSDFDDAYFRTLFVYFWRRLLPNTFLSNFDDAYFWTFFVWLRRRLLLNTFCLTLTTLTFEHFSSIFDDAYFRTLFV
jgi:hypothetical protein